MKVLLRLRLKTLFFCIVLILSACASDSSQENNVLSMINIHVNQVAYEQLAAKVAIISHAEGKTLSQFEIVDSQNKIIFSGRLEKLDKFDEWGKGLEYKRADFSALKKSGRYKLRVVDNENAKDSSFFDIAENALFNQTVADVINYYKLNRHTSEQDKNIRIIGTKRYVNVWGGWKDAGGDPGKYLSHLSYSNFMSPQQASFVVWSLSKTYELSEKTLTNLKLNRALLDEVFWGADYLHRILDKEGNFYATVFDKWGTPGAERLVTGYKGLEGTYTPNYQAAFREGGGLAIAALARSAVLANKVGAQGEFSASQYLNDAERAFEHLLENNLKYCDDGKENIVDDYTALMAAVELYKATRKQAYLDHARLRANKLTGRLTDKGWFVSDDEQRPYFSAVEAGFPVVSLAQYLDIESDTDKRGEAIKVMEAVLAHQFNLDNKVANPFEYARQNFRTYKNGSYSQDVLEGFFIPHANETNYWWQGESARLFSLAASSIYAGRVLEPNSEKAYGVSEKYGRFAQSQLDWSFGRNPFDLCMMYGYGVKNPPYAKSGGKMITGGISNGITGAEGSEEGRGIVFAPGPDENNWRWVEQWTPHAAWYLLAVSVMLNDQA